MIMEPISCMIVDVIRTTLDSCEWQECSDVCSEYLWNVAWNCPVVFHNENYKTLWTTLLDICVGDGHYVISEVF